MSGLFPILSIAQSGASVADEWLAATSDNIANLNTVNPAGQQPYRALQVVAQEDPNGGVRVTQVTRDQSAPDRVYDPGNPLADAQGFVTRPVVDVSLEMSNMLQAQRLFQLNLEVHRTGVETYKEALQIGAGA